MLLALMFHQIYHPSKPEALAGFENYLDFLSKKTHITVPGQKLSTKKLNTCLIFDDAYYDFYVKIFPLLVAKNLKAILAIPSGYIQPLSELPAKRRLSVSYPDGLLKKTQINDPLCTWAELQEMAESGSMIPACHTHKHVNLTQSCDLEQEIIFSKTLLEKKLNTPCDTFVYPYGACTPKVHHAIQPHFKYLFRIGSSSNVNWTPKNKLLYRINADAFWQKNIPFSKWHLFRFQQKYYLNKLRGK